MAKPEAERVEHDPDDGMIRSVVGEWTLKKHQLLRRYVDTTRATRRKWLDRRPTFIDLYSGPGRSRIEQTNEVVDGGVLTAAKEAAKGAPFFQFVIADLNENALVACRARMEVAGFDNVLTFHGAADATVEKAIAACDQRGLHLAYLDPFSIHALPFSVIRALGSRLERADLFIHFSVMDYKRNLVQMQSDGRLEAFAPGWQSAVRGQIGIDDLRRLVFEHWLNLIRGLGYNISDQTVPVAGNRTADFYWLILAARHRVADKFWKVAADFDPQRSLL